MDVELLFKLCPDPLDLACQLVRVLGGQKDELAAAAERWVAVAATAIPERSVDDHFPGHEAAPEVWRLLQALPCAAPASGFDPFGDLVRAARRERSTSDEPPQSMVTYTWELLESAVVLAPIRGALDRWSETLSALLQRRSEHFALVLASHFALEMPDLAYALLDESRRVQGGERRGASPRGSGAFPSLYPDGTFDPCRWIAIGRLSKVEPGQLTDRDREELEALTVDECLDTQFVPIFGSLIEGGRFPPRAAVAAREGLRSTDFKRRMNAVMLAVRFEETRDEGLDVLQRWVAETDPAPPGQRPFPDALDIFGHGMFYGHGWGRERLRTWLHPLMGALLRRGQWSLKLWRSLLARPLYSDASRLTQVQVDERIRDVAAEHFMQVARSSDEPLGRRRAAVEAIATLGAPRYAKDLGTLLKDAALRDDVRRAGARLRDVTRVGELPVDVALDLGVRAFLAAP